MKKILLLFLNPLGRQIVSAYLSFYLILCTFLFVFCCALLPFFPDFFSAVSRFACENSFARFAEMLFIAVLAIHSVLAIGVKLYNLIKNSQQHPELKFKGQPPVLSFLLPITGTLFCVCLYYYYGFLSSFDFSETGADYAQTLIELLRAKRIALMWFLGFIFLSFQFGRGISEALNSTGFSTDKSKTYVRYAWRTLVMLCVFVSLLSIYYCTETDLMLNIQEEPMVIIR